ncbi:MAG: class I SAM-dependent methyltransferase [Chloroflexi bacterium]|nr:class I SAM-dependent methyltransferase [Chloroflexota bacterium]
MASGGSERDRRGREGYDWEVAHRALYRLGYHRIRVLPLRRKPWTLPLFGHELGNSARFLLGGRNTFGVTLWPELYAGIFAALWPREHLLYRLFFLNERIPVEAVTGRINDEDIKELFRSGILRDDGQGQCFSPVRAVPYRHRLYFTDPWDRRIEGMAYLSYDSLFLADWVDWVIREGRGRIRRALDLCTGVGVLACTLADRCDRVVGTDVNPRAVGYARANAQANGITNVDFVVANLFDGIGKEKAFDLIVSNPPWVFLPESQRARMLDSYGGALGIEITLDILEQLAGRLSEGGQAVLLSKAPISDGRDLLLERAKEIAMRSGWALEYTEICPTPIPPGHEELYREHGISALKMVVIHIRQAGEYTLDRRRERWGSVRYVF